MASWPSPGGSASPRFGPLTGWAGPPAWLATYSGLSGDSLQSVWWTFLNFGVIWLLLAAGGYRLAERINMVLCLSFTLCLLACALVVFPQATGELASGLIPTVPTRPGELLMLVSLAGIVMAGSTTLYYTAWTEERQMGMFGFVARVGRRLRRSEIEPGL